MSKETQPSEVPLLAGLEGVAGLIFLIAGIAPWISPWLGQRGAAIVTALSAPYFALSWALWAGKAWARKTALILSIIGILCSFLILIPDLPSTILSLVANTTLIYYLTRPSVKNFYTKSRN